MDGPFGRIVAGSRADRRRDDRPALLPPDHRLPGGEGGSHSGGVLLLTSCFTTSDGVKIAYQETGSGDPIVFIHGIYGSRQAFVNQEEYFSPSFRCIAVDLRGHGESDKPNQVYSMARYADDVAELIRHLETPPAVLVGHSMGGQVVISVAARHPDLVRAVASLDSPSNVPGWQKRFHSPFDHLITFEGPYRKGVRRFLAAAYLPTDNPSWVGGLEERLAAIPDHMIVRAWDAMKAYEPTETLRKMKCPYLYIDSGQPGLDLELIRAVCPQLVVGKTVGAGHKALQAVPDQINAM
ncbi:MAG: alpha/beta hydrolase, partial [Acidimicrobiia bacterium]|nr:alpha/beta hydrolase [Acidimicrobiia bacterium]